MSVWLPILKRPGVSVLFQSYINQGYKDQYYQEILGIPAGLGSHRYVDGWVIVNTDDSGAFTSAFFPRLEAPPYVEYFLRRCATSASELLSLGEEIRSTPYERADRAALLFDFLRFSSASIRVMPFLNSMVFVQEAIEARLRSVLSEHFGVDADSLELDNHMQRLMALSERAPLASMAMAELTALVRDIATQHPDLARRLREGPADVSEPEIRRTSAEVAERVAAYLRKYDFLGTNYYVGEPTTLSDLCVQMGGFVARATRDDEEGHEEQLEVEELPAQGRWLLETAQTLQYLREYRLEALYKSGRDCRELLTRIGEDLGLAYDELLYLTFTEIQAHLTSTAADLDLTMIGERSQGWATYVEDNDPRIAVGAEVAALLEEMPDVGAAGDSLSGVTAFPGECEGTVRIVDDLTKARRVEAGDVLVTSMTMPYHVPAMARSGAVLTDEGGILSHAAIVARELQVPCIVGLQTATTTFADGDRVVVRAAPAGGVVSRVTDD